VGGLPITADPTGGDLHQPSPYLRRDHFHESPSSTQVEWTLGPFTDSWIEVFAAAEGEPWTALDSSFVKANTVWTGGKPYAVP
jgi:hypothetical protein